MDALLTTWHCNIPLFFPISATVSASKETIREKEQKIKQLTSQKNTYKDLIKKSDDRYTTFSQETAESCRRG